MRARDATVGIARTEPAHGARPEVREVERAYLDGIAAARRTLYIENQYLTAHVIVEALAARLAEPQGPEVVIVLPRACPGWLEETTMGVLRARVLRRLRDADRHRRLRVYAPIVPGLHGTSLAVHSKLLVADDALLRIGSANLSNRSMGFDTECDLWVEAGEGTEVAGAIARLRAELLGEHLGVPPGAVVEAQRRTGSLIAAVESLRGGARSLEPLAGEVPESLDRLIPDSALIDPERPMDPERLVEQLVPKDLRAPADHSVRRLVLALLALLGLAAAWRWTPLQAWAQPQTLAAWAESVAAHPLAPLLVVGAFTAGSFMMLPVTVMIVVTALAFGPVVGFGYALAGSLVAALANYGVGRLLGRTAVRRLGGSVIHRLSRRLARRGLLAIMTVRVLPVAPFTVINIAAGASHIRLRDFTLGTAVGMIPGILAMTVFTRQLANALQHPSLTSFAAVAIVVALLVLGAAWLRRRLGTNHRGGATAGGGGGG
ncbi:MAG: hypothetical protein GWO02_07360 [Gammaproteobacteria bacterium]|nr:hypothetical protein [Gammaproteobacteria bacterium]